MQPLQLALSSLNGGANIAKLSRSGIARSSVVEHQFGAWRKQNVRQRASDAYNGVCEPEVALEVPPQRHCARHLKDRRARSHQDAVADQPESDRTIRSSAETRAPPVPLLKMQIICIC